MPDPALHTWESPTLFIKTVEATKHIKASAFVSTDCCIKGEEETNEASKQESAHEETSNIAADFIFTHLASKYVDANIKTACVADTLLPLLHVANTNAKTRVEAHMRQSASRFITSQRSHLDERTQQELGCAVSQLKKFETESFKRQLVSLTNHIVKVKDAAAAETMIDALVSKACQQFDQSCESTCARVKASCTKLYVAQQPC